MVKKRVDIKGYVARGWIKQEAMFYVSAISQEDAEQKIGNGEWDEYDVIGTTDWETTEDAAENV